MKILLNSRNRKTNTNQTFQTSPVSAENLANFSKKKKNGARKLNLVNLTRKVVKIFEFFFENPLPPLEKILDPPLFELLTLFDKFGST